ncbi:uncharacterized protein LOC128640813 [Bombina bombina]|uniref:uncharacterized protein LOC128640813 n=1 Tax=Bombina bombina TaxID=8345 RepID=UPI00235ABF32|nr:uncharacterized protein LOC128640813 [Bombina bombina]
MIEKGEKNENQVFIGNMDNSQTVTSKCIPSIWKKINVLISIFVLITLAMIFFFCYFGPQCKAQHVCYIHANMENYSSPWWSWNNENCSAKLVGNQNQVKIYRRGFYMMHIQVYYSLENQDNTLPEIFSIHLIVGNKPEKRMISSGLPFGINITYAAPLTIVSPFLLEEGDILELKINFNTSKIERKKEKTFWHIYQMMDLQEV